MKGGPVDSIYLLIGLLVIANIGTIFTVLRSALKLSKEFGGLKNQVKVNKEDINKNEDRILELERSL